MYLYLTVALVVCAVRTASAELEGGSIAGMVIGITAVFVILGVTLAFLVLRQKRRQAAARRAFLEAGMTPLSAQYEDADQLAVHDDDERHKLSAHGRGGGGENADDSHGDNNTFGDHAMDEVERDERAEASRMSREGDHTAEADAGAENRHNEDILRQLEEGRESREEIVGVTIENRIRPRHHLPKGTVQIRHEDYQIRINFDQLQEVPDADPPPLTREELQKLEEAMNRVASPEMYGRAEYGHRQPGVPGTPYDTYSIASRRFHSNASNVSVASASLFRGYAGNGSLNGSFAGSMCGHYKQHRHRRKQKQMEEGSQQRKQQSRVAAAGSASVVDALESTSDDFDEPTDDMMTREVQNAPLDQNTISPLLLERIRQYQQQLQQYQQHRRASSVEVSRAESFHNGMGRHNSTSNLQNTSNPSEVGGVASGVQSIGGHSPNLPSEGSQDYSPNYDHHSHHHRDGSFARPSDLDFLPTHTLSVSQQLPLPGNGNFMTEALEEKLARSTNSSSSSSLRRVSGSVSTAAHVSATYMQRPHSPYSHHQQNGGGTTSSRSPFSGPNSIASATLGLAAPVVARSPLATSPDNFLGAASAISTGESSTIVFTTPVVSGRPDHTFPPHSGNSSVLTAGSRNLSANATPMPVSREGEAPP